jgi:hypothetical protein
MIPRLIFSGVPDSPYQSASYGRVIVKHFGSGHRWYTSNTLFPYLYGFTLNTRIYYFPNAKGAGHYTTKPRYFSNLTTGMIFTM